MLRQFPLILLMILTLVGPLAHTQTVEQIDEEIPPAIVEVMGESLQIKVGKSVYNVGAPALEDQFIFQELNNEQRESFNTNRVLFLSYLARALHSIKYGIGIGSIVKNRLSYHYESAKKSIKASWGPAIDHRVEQEIWGARERQMSRIADENAEQINLSLKERSEEAILATLKAMDQKLCWNQAPLMARSNEYGVMAAVGLVGLAGVRNGKGWGGSIDIGISVAFNRDQKSMIIQIFRDFEKYKNTTMPAVSIGGTVVKAGGFIANQRDSLTRKGTSFYPPMTPGFSSISSDYFATGFSSGITLPPSPFGDMLTYSNSLNQKALVRIAVSPMLKGFVRVQTGVGRDSLVLLLTPVVKAVAYVRSLFSASGSCNAIFVN